jgi:hypothetical protein
MLLTPNNHTNDRTYASQLVYSNAHNPESSAGKGQSRQEGMIGEIEDWGKSWRQIELDGYG